MEHGGRWIRFLCRGCPGNLLGEISSVDGEFRQGLNGFELKHVLAREQGAKRREFDRPRITIALPEGSVDDAKSGTHPRGKSLANALPASLIAGKILLRFDTGENVWLFYHPASRRLLFVFDPWVRSRHEYRNFLWDYSSGSEGICCVWQSDDDTRILIMSAGYVSSTVTNANCYRTNPWCTVRFQLVKWNLFVRQR